MANYELPDVLNRPKIVVNSHQYYLFDAPHTHENYDNRPTDYAKAGMDTYKAQGYNPKSPSTLLTSVFTEVNALMTAINDYGKQIQDWSMLSAYVQNGWRPDDESQGIAYRKNIEAVINGNPDFKKRGFPPDLYEDAKGILGRIHDPQRVAFREKWAKSTN